MKTLPRLLAPRASIAETVAANRAASQTAARNSVRDQILEDEGREEAAAKTPTGEDIAVGCSYSAVSLPSCRTTLLQII